MKKFSKVIESNLPSEKFLVDCNLKLLVQAENEGEAGYKADWILGGLEEQVDFEVINIERTEEDYNLSENISYDFSWSEIGGYLQKSFEFGNFKESMSFVQRVGQICEELNHHPIIIINFNKVRIKTKTHDTNSITELDHKLGRKIDLIFNI